MPGVLPRAAGDQARSLSRWHGRRATQGWGARRRVPLWQTRRAGRHPGRHAGRTVLVALALVLMLLGLAVASGVLTIPLPTASRAQVRAQAQASSRALPAASVVADGITAPPVDLLGHPVIAEDGEDPGSGTTDPEADEVEEADPEGTDQTAADPGDEKVAALGRLQVDAVGMDVALGSLPRRDVVTPPGYRAAYLLLGDSTDVAHPEAGTLVIAMHSVRTGFAPGNYLVSDRGDALVAPGAEIRALGHRWRVTGTDEVAKDDLPRREDIWADHPGRLVLITCRQTGERHTTANTVIIAELEP